MEKRNKYFRNLKICFKESVAFRGKGVGVYAGMELIHTPFCRRKREIRQIMAYVDFGKMEGVFQMGSVKTFCRQIQLCNHRLPHCKHKMVAPQPSYLLLYCH